MRPLAFALLALVCTACPDQIGQQCPAASSAVGSFTIALAPQHPSGECIVNQIDGGPADASLGQPTVATQTATLCEGPGSDGGLSLYLSVPNHGAAQSPLLDGGGYFFHLPATAAVGGTACGCPVAFEEINAGVLTGSFDGGSFALQPDGGLPYITGLSGTVTDHVTTPGGATCFCNLPCDVQYGLTGTRF